MFCLEASSKVIALTNLTMWEVWARRMFRFDHRTTSALEILVLKVTLATQWSMTRMLKVGGTSVSKVSWYVEDDQIKFCRLAVSAIIFYFFISFYCQ